ncbi:MAG TPA: AsmA family protein [Halothiobacillus sp.]|nr:AsmA family protein [Halothiobacillus sp.]
MHWLKRGIMLLVAMIVVAFIAAFAFVATFNPNDYKDQIAHLVQDKTGRSVQFAGPITVTLFPWLGATLKDVSLGNAPGFSEKNMLNAKTVEVKAALLPLLKGQFEIGTLVLDGATIHLARDRNGVTNWADLFAHQSSSAGPVSTTPAGEQKKSPIKTLAIGGIAIHDATLDWQDAVTGQTLSLQQLNLESGQVQLGQPVDLSLNFAYALQEPKLGALSGTVRLGGALEMDAAMQHLTAKTLKFEGSVLPSAQSMGALAALPKQTQLILTSPQLEVDLAKQTAVLPAFSLDLTAERGFGLTHAALTTTGDLTANWQQGVYTSKKIALDGSVQGIATHSGELKFTAQGELDAKIPPSSAAPSAQAVINLPNWQLESAPLMIKTSLKVTGLDQDMVITGPLAVTPFNPRQLAEAFKYRVPAMQSKQALTQCSLTGMLNMTSAQAMLNNLVFNLDGHDVTGSAGISDLKTQRIYVRLTGGVWDLNPYLPPGSMQKSTLSNTQSVGAQGTMADHPQTGASADAEIPLPIPFLRALNADIALNFAQLNYQQYQLSQVVLAFTAGGGQIQLKQLDFNAFGGTVQTHAGLDVRSSVPDWQGVLATKNIALQPALTAAMGEERVSGTGDINFDGRAQGSSLNKLKATLDGKTNFALRNGKIKGIDLGYMLRAAQARLQGDTAAVPKQEVTDFSTITASATIVNGIAHNDDLQAASPLLRVTGAGDVDLARATINYVLNAIVVNTATGQEGKALEKLKQLSVPIKITGTFAQPKFGIDLQALFKDQAKQKIENKVNQALDKRLGTEAAPIKNLLKGLGL